MYFVEDLSVGFNLSVLFFLFGEFFQGMFFLGVGVQIMGVDDKYLLQFDENVMKFWGSRYEFVFGYMFMFKG